MVKCFHRTKGGSRCSKKSNVNEIQNLIRIIEKTGETANSTFQQQEFLGDLKELKGTVKELLEYFCETGKEYSLDEVWEMAEEIIEMRKRLNR